MKYLLLALTLTAWITVKSQNVTLVLKDKNRLSVKVTATSNGTVFTSNGSFNYSQIDSALFELKDQKWQGTYDRFEANKIKVSFSGYESIEKIAKKELELKPVSDVYIMMDKFARQRNTGKALELLGVLAIGLSTLTKDPDVVKAAFIGGASISSIGFIIDMDASRHLRLKGGR